MSGALVKTAGGESAAGSSKQAKRAKLGGDLKAWLSAGRRGLAGRRRCANLCGDVIVDEGTSWKRLETRSFDVMHVTNHDASYDGQCTKQIAFRMQVDKFG